VVKYYERSNIIAGYVNKVAIAPMVFNGSCNTRLFEGSVEQCLIKELKAGQVVIMDNAAFQALSHLLTVVKFLAKI